MLHELSCWEGKNRQYLFRKCSLFQFVTKQIKKIEFCGGIFKCGSAGVGGLPVIMKAYEIRFLFS